MRMIEWDSEDTIVCAGPSGVDRGAPATMGVLVAFLAGQMEAGKNVLIIAAEHDRKRVVSGVLDYMTPDVRTFEGGDTIWDGPVNMNGTFCWVLDPAAPWTMPNTPLDLVLIINDHFPPGSVYPHGCPVIRVQVEGPELEHSSTEAEDQG